MTILHKNLLGNQLHESKGLSASSDKQYNLARTGANSWELLIGTDSATASSSSSLDVTDLGDYSTLVVTFQDVLTSGSDLLQMRFSSNNGSSFDNSAIYYSGLNQDGTGAMAVFFNELTFDSSQAADYRTGKIIISNFNKAVPSAVYGHIATTTGVNFTTSIAGKGFRGFVNSATAWNAFTLYANPSAVLTSGKIIIEGIKS